MKTAAIIQARMGSTRLPGKVLMDVSGQTILQHVIRRVGRFREIDKVVLATSTAPGDDRVAEAGRQLGVLVIRGSENDVLDRYLQAARFCDADLCVRITSDCPLIDPEVSDRVVASFKRAVPRPDYASNKIPQSYPRGLDTEVFTRHALERTALRATEVYERTHVTIYMYEHPEAFRLLSVTSDDDRADWRWTVDAPEDLEFVRQVYARLGADGNFGWRDVIALLEREPALRDINRHVVQKPVRAA